MASEFMTHAPLGSLNYLTDLGAVNWVSRAAGSQLCGGSSRSSSVMCHSWSNWPRLHGPMAVLLASLLVLFAAHAYWPAFWYCTSTSRGSDRITRRVALLAAASLLRASTALQAVHDGIHLGSYALSVPALGVVKLTGRSKLPVMSPTSCVFTTPLWASTRRSKSDGPVLC